MPGLLGVFAWAGEDGTTTAGVRGYLFSADAAENARREEPAWRTWPQGLSVPA